MNNWTRKDLKERAKISFKQNYWKCVLVALIMALVGGGIGASTGGTASSIISSQTIQQNNTYDTYDDEDFDVEDFFEDDADTPAEINDYDVDGVEDQDIDIDADELIEHYIGNNTNDYGAATGVAFGIVLAIILVIVLFVTVLVLAISAFLVNPLTIGAQRFFYRNGRENADLDNLGFGFKNNYLNTVKTMFFRDLKLIGWSLLLVIPGIIKSYEYMMIPFILQDNPEMNSKEAFSLSKTMMMGNKWKAFVLDLSFIGWILLTLITAGIVGIFYVNPYIHQTRANLYAALKGDYEGGAIDFEPEVRQDAAEQQFVEFDL